MPPQSPSSSSSPSPPRRRTLAFARLRTTHDCTLRQLVNSSWDDPPSTNSLPSTSLPARSVTDVSGRALQAAQLADVAARRAAAASATARAAAAYARRLAEQPDSAHVAAPLSPLADRPASPPQPTATRLARRFPERVRSANRADGVTFAAAGAPLVYGVGARHSPTRAITDVMARPPDEYYERSTLNSSAAAATAAARNDAARNDAAHMMHCSFITPVELGKLWSFDLVAIWHNAIRLELADLHDIVSSLLLPNRSVTMAEVRAFFAWFSSFEAFVITFLKAEEEVIFPWLEQWGRIRGSLSTLKRITTKGVITRAIRDTAACAQLLGINTVHSGLTLTNPHRHYYDALNVGVAELQPKMVDNPSMLCSTVVQKIADHVSNFSVALEDYFHEQENYLPAIIGCLYDEQDAVAASIERKIMCALWKCGRKEDCTMIILRAVELVRAPYPKVWTHRNLRRMERMALALWRRRYNGARGAVTAKFKMRKTFWERAAAALQLNFGGAEMDSETGSTTSPMATAEALAAEANISKRRMNSGGSRSSNGKFGLIRHRHGVANTAAALDTTSTLLVNGA
ncbi:hypothetical protein BWQ96_03993 [Gracilariopsis chorda]|uniref:Uncharacterized protein n=1 Tax=Gracilariopsis chorda TaxID=448386 RepID=A0A2V3IVN6_9FLOR|nr:hypothetical protein BWQ96_03993 [Gracilariopsis chorda]|eukprot:PXF46208.1 hypothetical protein BWQ96_03993 [Gracilariopsis chorda]